jgi:hypothetical protein
MPGTNLTRDEAAERARLLQVDSYAVELDLTASPTTFPVHNGRALLVPRTGCLDLR